MKEGEQYAGGLELNFFESTAFEKVNDGAPFEEALIHARNVLRLLMHGWSADWSHVLSSRLLQAVFVERDYELTRAMRIAFQQGFQHIFSQLQNTPLTPQQLNQAQLYISNCLCMLPFSDITPYEGFSIPQWIDGQWQLVDYKVVPIELTANNGVESLFLQDKDRVYAYGLEPIDHPQAESHLIFMGTTYPAGQGHFMMVETDLEGFETAGQKLYNSGHTNITRWIDSQPPKKIHVCGASLGGALSLLLAIDQGHKLSRVDALNPPGLYEPWQQNPWDHWGELVDKPAVYIQKQGNDPVSLFGVWKEDWHVLHVLPPKDKQGPNAITDHALNYAGFADTQFIGVDTQKDNEEHKKRNFWLYTLLRGIVYYVFMVPLHYLVLPPLHFVFSHKLQLLFTAAFATAFYLLPIIPLALTTSLIINALIYATASSYLLTTFIESMTDAITGQQQSDLTKLVQMLKKHPILAVGLTITVTTALASIIAFPALLTVGVSIAIAFPLICSMLHKLTENVLIVLSYNRLETPKLHQPTLARNESLDIYRNTMEAHFSEEEIQAYVQIQHLLKEEQSIANEPEESHQFDIVSSPDEKMITVRASKAQIHDMRKTVALLQQFGIHQEKELKKELLDHQQQYEEGKPLSI